MRITIIAIALAGLILPSLARGQSQPTQPPNFQIEIQAAGDSGPASTMKNLNDKTLTACVFRFAVSSEPRSLGEMVWDPVTMGVGGPRRERPLPQEPLEPQATMVVRILPHLANGPLPDSVEILAGVWATGETFGDDDWVKILLKNRANLASAYEQAISLLRGGLDHNWNLDQYLDALKHEPNSLPFVSIRSTLEARGDAEPRTLNALIDSFTRNLDRLRQAKPSDKSSASQPPSL